MLPTSLIALLAAVLVPVTSRTQAPSTPAVITVDAGHPGAEISPTMFGVFFEDINFGADGGLYPELIKNRSFEFDQELAGWHPILPITSKGDLAATRGELILRTAEPLNTSNPHYLRVHAYVPGYGVWNSGYRGIGVKG